MERTFLEALEGTKSSKGWVSLAIAEDELSVICIVPIKGKTDRDLIGAHTAAAHSVAATMHNAIEFINDGSTIGNLLESALPAVIRDALRTMAEEAMGNEAAEVDEAAEEEIPELEPSDEGELLEKD